MSAGQVDIDIITPPGWQGIDLQAAERRSVVRRLVDERIAVEATLAEHRDELVDVVTQAAHSAREQGVIIAAVMLTAGEHGAPIVAALNVAGVPISEEALSTMLADPDADGRTRVMLRHAGSALRVERAYQTRLYEAADDALSFSVQYFVPVPDTGTVIVVSFVSPSLSERAELTALFDRIAQTLHVDQRNAEPAQLSAAAAAR